MRIAVIGAGISGLGSAWLLDRRHAVVLYEKDARVGGHSNTVDVTIDGRVIPVDTGFIVYNEPNYPNLTRLFQTLDIQTHDSDMSFGMSLGDGRFEYSGSGPRALLAQSGNLLRLDFHRMLLEILRFNRAGTAALERGIEPGLSLGGFLDQGGFAPPFRRRYLLPMAAAIWSGSTAGMLDFPASSFLRFFSNHGLLSINDQPDWRTVTGGSRSYVERIAAPLMRRARIGRGVASIRRTGTEVEVVDVDGEVASYDQVVIACHADQALAMIEAPSRAERSILGAFTYRSNEAVLHRDPRLMPRRRQAWSSWNYLADDDAEAPAPATVTYWMNRLQGIAEDVPLFVSLNPRVQPDEELTIGRFAYDHPQFTAATLDAQRLLPEIQGRDRLWFAGAHWGYGFHEDGLRSGLDVSAGLGCPAPWWPAPRLPEVGSAPSLPLPAAAKPE
jgi:predicted NAD/FAD-binding protein